MNEFEAFKKWQNSLIKTKEKNVYFDPNKKVYLYKDTKSYIVLGANYQPK